MEEEQKMAKLPLGLTPYQAIILIFAAVSMVMIYRTMVDMQACQTALKVIGDLEVCRACDVLEQAGVIK